jgi:hypothetical protein
MPRERGCAPLNWRDVEWFVYDDPVTTPTTKRTLHVWRVSPRQLSPGELRRFERHVATVRRCPLKLLRALLKRGVPPAFLQAHVDSLEHEQYERTPHAPNGYVLLCAQMRAKACELTARASTSGPRTRRMAT